MQYMQMPLCVKLLASIIQCKSINKYLNKKYYKKISII